MARLAGISTADVQANRLEVARNFARQHGVTVVLKGARTLIAHPDGRVAVNTTGNPGMAKGGSGDLLTGMIAGLLAQYPRRSGDTAVEAAVFLHGLAADLAVRESDEHTLLATDSLPHFSQAFRFRSRTANGYVWLQGLPGECSTGIGLPRGSRMSKEAPVAEGRVHEFTTRSGADTVEVGRKLAALLKPPQLLLLRGELGTGKTTLVKGIAQALDAAEPDEVTSPTFTLIHEYDGTHDGKPVKLFHIDVYRLEARAAARNPRPRRTAHARCAGAGGVGRQVQEHQEARHRRNRHQLRRRRRPQDHRDAERRAELAGVAALAELAKNPPGHDDSANSASSAKLL